MMIMDHLPFSGPNLGSLTATFAGLGFQVSPPGAYTSPDGPGGPWQNRAVFLRQGWFDLLLDADASGAASPGAALFRSDGPDLGEGRSEGLSPEAGGPYHLRHAWDKGDAEAQLFRIAPIDQADSPLPLARIVHTRPGAEPAADWRDHPNSARALTGVIVRGGESQPLAAPFDRWIRQWSPENDPPPRDLGDASLIVCVQVAALAAADTALAAGGAGRLHTARALYAPPFGAIGCAFRFAAASELLL